MAQKEHYINQNLLKISWNLLDTILRIDWPAKDRVCMLLIPQICWRPKSRSWVHHLKNNVLRASMVEMYPIPMSVTWTHLEQKFSNISITLTWWFLPENAGIIWSATILFRLGTDQFQKNKPLSNQCNSKTRGDISYLWYPHRYSWNHSGSLLIWAFPLDLATQWVSSVFFL